MSTNKLSFRKIIFIPKLSTVVERLVPVVGRTITVRHDCNYDDFTILKAVDHTSKLNTRTEWDMSRHLQTNYSEAGVVSPPTPRPPPRRQQQHYTDKPRCGVSECAPRGPPRFY